MKKTKFIVESVEIKFSPNIYEYPSNVRGYYNSHSVHLSEQHIESNEIKFNVDVDNLKVNDKIKTVDDDGLTKNYFVKDIESFHIVPKHEESYFETIVYLVPAITHYDKKETTLTYHELCDLEEKIRSELNKQNEECKKLHSKNWDLTKKLEEFNKKAEKRKRILSFWKK